MNVKSIITVELLFVVGMASIDRKKVEIELKELMSEFNNFSLLSEDFDFQSRIYDIFPIKKLVRKYPNLTKFVSRNFSSINDFKTTFYRQIDYLSNYFSFLEDIRGMGYKGSYFSFYEGVVELEELTNYIINDYIIELFDKRARFCIIDILSGIKLNKSLNLQEILLDNNETKVALSPYLNIILNNSKQIAGFYEEPDDTIEVKQNLDLLHRTALIINSNFMANETYNKFQNGITTQKDITIREQNGYYYSFNIDKLYTNESKALTILRLFKVGDIRVRKSQLFRVVKGSNKDILIPLTAANGHGEFKSMYEYELRDQNDVKLLQEFWKQLSNSEPFKHYKQSNKKSYLELTCNNYSDALLEKDKIKSIIYVLAALETLFYKDDDPKFEISYKLRMRITKLFSLLNDLFKYNINYYNYKNVKEIINNAYSIRSSFLHGNATELEKQLKKFSEFNILLDYLRISLIIEILIEKERNKFIECIDNSMLDEQSENEFKSLLVKKLTVIKECLKPSTY